MHVCVCLISGQYNSNVVDDSSEILHASVFETKGEMVNCECRHHHVCLCGSVLGSFIGNLVLGPITVPDIRFILDHFK